MEDNPDNPDNPVVDEVQKFNRSSLKKTKTEVKTVLPSQSDIDQEKKEAKEEKE